MNTIFPDPKDTSFIFIGNNYSIKFLSKFKVAVYHYGSFFKEVEIFEQYEKRLFVIDLIERHGVTKTKLAYALNISRQSIDNWLEIYKSSGQLALVNSSKKKKKREISRPIGNKNAQLKELRDERTKLKQDINKKNAEKELNIDFDQKQATEYSDTEHFNSNFKEEENRYAGSFIYWPIFQKDYDLMSLIFTKFQKYSTVFYLFLMMHINRIPSVEQLKVVFKSEFGRLIGAKKLLSAPKIWAKIHGIVELKISGKLINDFFKNQIYKGMVSLWYLFIDGHFVPYTGKETVKMNYHTQTDKMEPGQNEIFIHDIEGRIVYFDLQEGKGNMLGVIKEKSKEYSDYLGNISPLFVADKEIWGVEKFLSLNESARFITWEKNTRKEERDEIDIKLFSEPFFVHGNAYQVYETYKTYKNASGQKIKLRQLIIYNHNTKKRGIAVSNDIYEDALSLSFAMLNRWGKSENGFKHYGERTKIHYNPVYEIERLSADQSIPNPEYKNLQNEMKNLKKNLGKTEQELGRKEIKTNKDGSIRKSNVRDRLQHNRVVLLEQIENQKIKLSNCSQRVDISKVKPDKKFKIIEIEGKKIWDFSGAVFWNSRKKLIKILKEFLPNERDLIPVLEAITKCKGIIKSNKDTMVITLEPLERPQFRQAQIQFCRKLNNMNATFDNGKLILFDVQKKSKLYGT